MKRFLFILIVLSQFLLPVNAGIKDWFKNKNEDWNASTIPMVHLRDSTKWCCNPDNVIKPETVDSIDFYCRKLNHKGIESVIVIVNKVQDADCFRVAQDIGNNYGVGSKETRRGLIIVVAYQQHKYFIATGKGLEADLTDAECNRIAEDYLKPAMKDNNPDKAMLNTVKVIHNKFDFGVAELYKGQKQHDAEVFWTVVIVIVVIFIFLAVITKGEIFFILFDGGSSGGYSGGSSGGGSFGGGSFGGGGAGGSW